MKIIFLTMSTTQTINRRGIYTDLMRKFRNDGHKVYVVSPFERRTGLPTSLKEEDGVHILGVHTLNLKRSGAVEKGVGQVLVESQFNKAINFYKSNPILKKI